MVHGFVTIWHKTLIKSILLFLLVLVYLYSIIYIYSNKIDSIKSHGSSSPSFAFKLTQSNCLDCGNHFICKKKQPNIIFFCLSLFCFFYFQASNKRCKFKKESKRLKLCFCFLFVRLTLFKQIKDEIKKKRILIEFFFARIVSNELTLIFKILIVLLLYAYGNEIENTFWCCVFDKLKSKIRLKNSMHCGDNVSIFFSIFMGLLYFFFTISSGKTKKKNNIDLNIGIWETKKKQYLKMSTFWYTFSKILFSCHINATWF